MFLACVRNISIPSQARKAMQEQLARNKELTQKVRVELPEEEPADVPEEDLTSTAIPPVSVGASRANPWMLGKPSDPAQEPDVPEDLGNAAVPVAVENKEEMSEDEEELSEEEALLQDFQQKRQARQRQPGSPEQHSEELTVLPGVCSVTEQSGSLGLCFHSAVLFFPLLFMGWLFFHCSLDAQVLMRQKKFLNNCQGMPPSTQSVSRSR